MTITSWPYVDQSTTDIEYSLLFREFTDDGVIGSAGDNSLLVTADATGMNVKVQPGSLLIRGYIMRSTAIETLPLVAADTQARIDQVIAELNVSIPNITERVKLKVLKGTPGTNPLPFGLTQTETGVWQNVLANVPVGASATTIPANAPVDRRVWGSQEVGNWRTDELRPKNPRKWKMGYNEQRGYVEIWTGSLWRALVDWGTLAGVPGSFTPSAHNHPIDGVTGLQAELDKKAPKVSPTFTGTVTAPGATAAAGEGFFGKINGIMFYAGPTIDPNAPENSVWFSA